MTSPITRTNKTGFEVQDCSRCGGSGQFSFNLMHGTRCYGCGGAGVAFTKRGKAARAHLLELQTRPVSEVKVGHLIHIDGRWRTVVEIQPSTTKHLDKATGEWVAYLDLVTRYATQSVFPDSRIRAVNDPEQQNDFVSQALAYQSTLNVTGKPAARRSVK